MAHVGSIRGLSQYIKKIRAASTQEERDAIVQSELAKIRQKYSSSKKVSGVNTYDRKKYTWKLLYSHMMGYDVDFGHKQAADLIPSNNFEEKQVGYQALTILLNEEDEFMMLPVNNVMKDLGSRNELFVSLSLCFAGSVAGPEMSSAIAQAVITAVMNQRLSEHCRKKAALCLLRIYHKLPDEAGLITPETWADNFLNLFTSAVGTGMHLALCALLLGVIERQGPSGYEKLQPVLVTNLTSVVAGHGAFGDCLYYGIPSPWLQCKYLRLLAMMPPDENSGLRAQLETPLRHACEQSVPSGKSNQNPAYARTAVLTEAAQLCLQIDRVQLLSTCLAKMTSLIERKDPNTRFIALSTLCTLCETADMASALQPVLPQVVGCLSDSDPGVKKRAIDLLVNVCDQSSVEQVSAQLLRQLPLASAEVRGELVVKVAILAERYAPSLSWYIQTMLALMDLGSEEVSDDVWFRAVQAVAGSTADRPSTTEAIAKSLESGSLSVPLVSTAGYVLSEFADQVPDRSPAQLAEELTPRLALAPVATQGLLLTALMKLRMHAPHDVGLKRHVEEIFTEYAADANTDIQQRAVEYLAYSKMGDNTVVRQELFAPMPEWQDKAMLFSQGSQELNGQNSGIRQQEGAFAEAAAAEGAAEPADLKSAANTVTDEDQNENDEEADEAVNEPGTEDRETLDAAQVDTVAEQVTDAQLFSVDRVPPEASAGLGHLLDIGTPTAQDVSQTPSTLGTPGPEVTQPTTAQPDDVLFGLSDPAVAMQPAYPAAPPALPQPPQPIDVAALNAPMDVSAGQSMNPFQQPLVPVSPVVQDSYNPGVYMPPASLSPPLPGAPQDPTMGPAPSPRQNPSLGLAGFQNAQAPAANPFQSPQMASALDSGAVLSTTSAPVPSAASPESQLSTFPSATTGGPPGGLLGAYNSGMYGDRYPGSLQMPPQDLQQGMQGLGLHGQHPSSTQAVPSQQQPASLNPFAAVASTGSAPLSPAHGYGNVGGAPASAGLGGGPTGRMASEGLTGGLTGSFGSLPYATDMTGGGTMGMSGSAPQYTAGGTGGAYTSVVTGGSTGAAGATGVSTANPFATAATAAPDTRVPLDTTSTAALMAPLTYSGDRDRMLYLGKGVLFEDSCLQVGFVAAPPDKASGSRSITLFCGNKLENSHLADFNISLSPSSSVPSIALTEPSPVLSACDQQKAAVIARGVGDIGSDPSWANSLPAEAAAAISYTYPPTGQRTTIRVEVPLVRGSFATPADHVSQASFFAAWARLTGGGAGGPLASGMARLPAPIASGDALSGKMLKLGFSDGGARLDPTSVLNYAGETVLAGGTQALARVEVNPADCAHINVTILSSLSAAVSEEVRNWVVGGLSYLALVP